MSLTLSGHRSFSDALLPESTTSVATSPVPMDIISPCAGLLKKVLASAHGTFTGTITYAVTINGGGTDVANGTLTIAAGTGVRSASVDLAKVAQANGGLTPVVLNEGDVITITPSGGTGSNIPGAACAVVAEQ